jgi:HB1, ASXL, restriction endonuclease HTH domain
MASKKKSKKGSTSRTQKPASKQPEVEAVATPAESTTETGTAKPKSRGSRQRGKAGSKKLSALDAAAKVLEEAGQPMTCAEMIAAMAQKGYWTSPAGKTPEGTLYSALLRELNTKGDAARFHKTGRGQFARKAQDS